MIQRKFKQPGFRYAFIISLIVHLLAVIILAIFFKSEYKPEEFIHADIIQAAGPVKSRRANLIKPLIIKNQHTSEMPENLAPLEMSNKFVDKPILGTNIKFFSNVMIPFDISAIALNSSPSGTMLYATTSGSGVSENGRAEKFHQPLVANTKLLQSTKPVLSGIYNNQMSPIDLLPYPETPLEKIAKHLLASKQGDKVDIVFVVDASQSMQDNINAVTKYLSGMMDIFQSAKLDFTIGVVIFRDSTLYSMLGWDVKISPQTTDVKKIKDILYSIKCRGGEKALDALMQAIAKVKFRKGAQKHFILVTDEYVSGSYSVAEVLNKIQKSGIKVYVIGVDEPFQKIVARRTGGIWLFIGDI